MQQQPSSSSSSSTIFGSLTKDAAGAAATLSVMMENEQTVYGQCDYLRKSTIGLDIEHDKLPKITEDDHLKIVDW